MDLYPCWVTADQGPQPPDGAWFPQTVFALSRCEQRGGEPRESQGEGQKKQGHGGFSKSVEMQKAKTPGKAVFSRALSKWVRGCSSEVVVLTLT